MIPEYTYLGNLEDIDNTPVKEELEGKSKKRGYGDDQIKIAINELVTRSTTKQIRFMRLTKVYSLLRYGRQGVKRCQWTT